MDEPEIDVVGLFKERRRMSPDIDVVGRVKEIRGMSVVSNTSGFLQSFSLNSSGEATNALKRKLMEDSDLEGSASKKENRLGSPLSKFIFRCLRE